MPHTYPIPRQPVLPMKHESDEVDRRRRRMLLGVLACVAQPVLAQGL
ncbi:MAG: hypothetical protein JWP52_4310, partial [Rhizobacter sp.]|nr:hypothetical protein [Rhizobacter sp.]